MVTQKKKKQKKCKWCEKLFQPFRTTQVVCSPKCALKFNEKKQEETTRRLDELRSDISNRVKLMTLIRNVVNTCHKYVRLRDKGKNCIACDTSWKDDFQASHYYKAELYSTLKFDEMNIHSGCKQCNLRKEGNLNQYAINLPRRIGVEKFDDLNKRAEQEKKTQHKWDRNELEKLREYYKEKLKELNRKI